MAAALVRRVSGLLGPLGARTLAHLSGPLRPPGLLPRLRPAVGAPRPAALHQPPRWNLLDRVSALGPPVTQQSFRNLTYFGLRSGKRKTVKSVTERFMRLHCGLWIRRKAGYKKKLWKKKPARRKRLREHVFCNKTQSKLLNKMTTSFWKRRNWFVNDPYLKYHNRVNLKV